MILDNSPRHASPKSAQRFMRQLDSAILPSTAAPRLRGAAALPPDSSSVDLKNLAADSQSGFLVGQQILSFDPSVNDELREAAATSTLYAQLVADSDYGKRDNLTDSQNWYKSYFNTLSNLGWIIQGQNFSHYQTKGQEAQVDKAVIDIITGLLGPGATAIQMVTKLLTALKNAGNAGPLLTLFQHQAVSNRLAQFQVTFAANTTGFLVESFAFSLAADKEIDQVLFFTWNSANVSFDYSSASMSVDLMVYSTIKDQLYDAIAQHAKAVVKKISLS